MANKSPAAQEQRDIVSFIEWLEYGLVTFNHEFGAIGDKSMKFTRHDGHTYSMRRGSKVITLTLKVTDTSVPSTSQGVVLPPRRV